MESQRRIPVPRANAGLPTSGLTRALWRLVRRACLALRLYPNVVTQCMPFKTYEFHELLRGAKIASTDRILDLGCGVGHQTLIVGRRCREIVGVDVSGEVIEQARTHASAFEGEINARFLCGQVQDLLLAPASFDKALSFCVIEHIPEVEEVLSTLRKLLEPGGQLLLSADSLATIDDPVAVEQHREAHHVHQYFTSASLRDVLTRAGFVVDEIYSIFRSPFARREFLRAIRNGFHYSFGKALVTYWRLRWHDAFRSKNRPGIFLVARCHRPAL